MVACGWLPTPAPFVNALTQNFQRHCDRDDERHEYFHDQESPWGKVCQSQLTMGAGQLLNPPPQGMLGMS